MQYKYNVKLNCRSSSEGGGRRLEEKEKEQVAKQKVGSGVIHGGDHGGDQRGRGEHVENFVHHLPLALRNHLRDLTTKNTKGMVNILTLPAKTWKLEGEGEGVQPGHRPHLHRHHFLCSPPTQVHPSS